MTSPITSAPAHVLSAADIARLADQIDMARAGLSARPPGWRRGRRIARRGRRAEAWFRARLAVAAAGSGGLSFAVVLDADWLESMVKSADSHFVAIGGVFGLAFYLWRVSEGETYDGKEAMIRTAAGGAFGYLGGNIASGSGMNQQLQMSAAAIGGGTGPKYIDRLVGAVVPPARASERPP